MKIEKNKKTKKGRHIEEMEEIEGQIIRRPRGRKVNKHEEIDRYKGGQRFGKKWFPYHD